MTMFSRLFSYQNLICINNVSHSAAITSTVTINTVTWWPPGIKWVTAWRGKDMKWCGFKEVKDFLRGNCSQCGVLWSVAVYRLVFRIDIENSKEIEWKMSEKHCSPVCQTKWGILLHRRSSNLDSITILYYKKSSCFSWNEVIQYDYTNLKV